MADLVTRCPSCRTAFRVVQDQLRLRDGRVRCGVCHHVFDARAEEVAFDPRDLGAGVERQRVPAPTAAPAFTPPSAASTRPATPSGSSWPPAAGRRAELPEAPRDDAWPRGGMRPEPGQPTPPPGQGLPPFVARRPEPTRSSLDPRGAPVQPRPMPPFVARPPRVEPAPPAPRDVPVLPPRNRPDVVSRGRAEPLVQAPGRAEPALPAALRPARTAPAATRDEPVLGQRAPGDSSWSRRDEPVVSSSGRDTPAAPRAEPSVSQPRSRMPSVPEREEPVVSHPRPTVAATAQRAEPMMGQSRSNTASTWDRDEPVVSAPRSGVASPSHRDEPVVGRAARPPSGDMARAEPVMASRPEPATGRRDEPVVSSRYVPPAEPVERSEPPLGVDDDADDDSDDRFSMATATPVRTRREDPPVMSRPVASSAAPEEADEDTEAEPPFAAGPGDGWHTPLVAARRRRESGLGRRLLLGGCVLALVALVFQAAWWWRTPLATYAPGTRPALETMCRWFGCTVDYVRAPRLLSIESSSVQPDTSQPGGDLVQRLTLNAVLRNRANHDQPWPSLELSLTDFSDTVIMRRVVPPEGYLGPAAANGSFAAGSEQRIAVGVSARGAPITGYRLALFFP